MIPVLRIIGIKGNLYLLLPFDWYSYSRIRSAGASTAHISWFSPLSQPFTTRLTVLTYCQASCHAMTSSVTWTTQAVTQRIYTKITLQYPHWSVCWAKTTSFPSLLSQTTPIHTTRLVGISDSAFIQVTLKLGKF